MAPKAVAARPDDRMSWWDRFQNLAETRVQEGNMVAGEQLWQIVKSPDIMHALVIQSTRHPADFVECSLDGQTSVLTCRAGAAIGSGVLSFPMPGAQTEAESSMEQTLGLILDQLVWVEENAAEMES